MAAGKNKLLRFCRLYVGGYDLSGDSREIGTLKNSMGEVDLTGWGQDGNYIADMARAVGLTGYQALFNDLAGGSFSRLAAQSSQVLTLAIGGGAAPAVGDMAYLLPAVQMSSPVDFSNSVAVLSADFNLDASQVSANYGNPFGVVLLPLTALSNTTTGTAVDVGTGAAGWIAQLHVTVSSGGTWAFIIQYSATGVFGGEETTLGTFALTGSAVGAEFLSGTADVDGYVRFKATKTSGTCTVFCALARNQ